MSLKNQCVNSDAYWSAETWDPDPSTSRDDPGLLHVWAGGLASTGLGLGRDIGPPIDVAALQIRPTLAELYDVSDSCVGSGSFGIVRPGKHRNSDTICVVKAASKVAAGENYHVSLVDGDLGETLLRMSKEKSHPNLTMYYDILEGCNNFYVVMEELRGPELLQQVEELFPVTESYIQRIVKQMLSGLQHIHDNIGMFHRDVKLANFRFRDCTEGSPLVLLDFGFAASTNIPWDGSKCGTKMFMAPEVVSSSAQTPFLAAIDLWAVGVILYVLLTGDSPIQDVELKLFAQPGTLTDAASVLDKAMSVQELDTASSAAVSLLLELLVIDPQVRTTAARALEHQFFCVTQDQHQE